MPKNLLPLAGVVELEVVVLDVTEEFEGVDGDEGESKRIAVSVVSET